MEVVEALKDISQIEAMKKYLKEHSQRDYLLFVIGINTGLKITELLSMKFEEVLHEDGTVKEFYSLPVKDEKFKQDIYLNTKVKEALLEYVQSIDVKRENYVFQSNKTTNSISRQQAYRVIHSAAEAVGIVGKIGTNSMRKTFGYHAYKRGIAIALLQKHFHHATPSETLKYLGISKDEEFKTEIDVDL
ncbi:DNA integration/recombination/invertion protein [Bacillus cereus]|uniref:Integrase n=1 Tax=Bacillus anthracis TaxID=1392 RepID=A0A0J1HRR1_BACAN|nr:MULTISPECIES: tyrosine-type recombinase/integrase [Bacillus]EDX66282.1 site-specific recombinase, phage integrase family [Bacillus cereus NVH0597-99]EEL43341.1 Site-specific recombinase, phage integrase [Bacillus cereus Rock3-42]CUB56620.1 Tyrosine recombinase XerD [Bacillus subtilis]AJG61666.1 phage integrase family protein [Bacillus cereus D17]AXO95358.1 site-specific integrase [Bacillus anthracis]